MRKRLLNLLKILVSLGLLTYLLAVQVDFSQLVQQLAQARVAYLAAAALLIIAGTALRALRWQVLLQPLDIHVPLRRLVYLYFVGAFFNLFLPTGMGGDAVKMGMLAQQSGKMPEAIGATLVDRAAGLWVLFVLALLAMPFSYHLLPPGWLLPILAITLGGVVGGFLLVGTPLLPWLGARFRLPGQQSLMRFYRSVSQLGYRALGLACLVSLIFDLLLILFNLWIAASLNIDQPLGIFLLFTPIISFSLALPVSIGGLGVREQTYLLLFAPVGVGAAAATAMSLANYFLTNIIVGLLGGLLYLLQGAWELLSHERQTS